MKRHHLVAVALLVLCVAGTGLVDARRRRGSSSSKRKESKAAAVSHPQQNVLARGLVTKSPTWRSISQEHGRYSSDTSTSHFSQETLVYVTPWNNHGYDIAKIFASKFTYVSPVWLQLRPQGITGTHDIDAGWMADVRRGCAGDDNGSDACPQIVPRLIWEVRGLSPKQQAKAIDAIVALCLQHDFDGIVLELNPLNHEKMQWIQALSVEMHSTLSRRNDQLKLIVVLPPTRIINGNPMGMNHDTFSTLARYVDRVSLMTYDYSSQEGRSGPNAPLPWVQLCVRSLAGSPPQPDLARKILVGMPFYGYDNVEAVLGNSVVELLQKYHPRLIWDDTYSEHHFTYTTPSGSKHTVFFPTLQSIQARLDLAENLGAGISIWEIGQGLDYFYDLL